jgi:sphingomyelin phosphodiesterase
VCAGAIALEGPILAADLRAMSIPSKTATLFCTTLTGLCQYPAVDTPSIDFPPKPANASRPALSGQTPFQIVHYSDIHVDPFYVTGSNANCTKPICCRDYDNADDPGNNDDPTGPNGDHACDVPKSLEESMFAAIRETVKNPFVTLFTGDIVDHAVWNTTQPQNTIDIQDAYGRMTGMGAIYGTVGNHEQTPCNALQPTAVGTDAKWLYNLVSGLWTQWIGSDAATEEQSFGAYSALVPNTALRIISLNTNLYYTHNYWLYEKTMEDDPSGQFVWLVDELSSAEAAGERVYIIGHMPFGIGDCLHDPSNRFDQIVNRYSDTIAGMFFGHTHKDEFEISYSDYESRSYANAVGFSYIMPSLTPTDGMPAFRVYSVDPVTFAVLDSTTYIADMTNPAFQTTGPVWTKYYSAKETYGPLVTPAPGPNDELSPAFWHNVTEVVVGDDDAFQNYWVKRSRGWNVPECEGTCKTDAICQLQSARAQDNCVTLTPGINFAKRSATTSSSSNEAFEIHCGISITKKILHVAVGGN